MTRAPYVSDERDTMRWGSIGRTDLFPTQDTRGLELTFSFGSAHATIFQMAMADASVRTISYNIAIETHKDLCNRRDGRPITEF